jgi:hypothetical protein
MKGCIKSEMDLINYRVDLHVAVGGLGQHPPLFHQEAKLPRSSPFLALGFINDHGIEQPATANFFNQWIIEGAEGTPEQLAQAL